MLGNAGARNLLDQLMNIYIIPELRKRELAQSFSVHVAQIIFFPDRRPPEVRINEEVKAIAKVKLKPGIRKQKNEPIYENEIENLSKISLTKDDDSDCAHVTLLRIGEEWTIEFDFRYNKDLALRHIRTAKQFYEVAQFSYEKKFWSPFVDNLFSSCELVARATLLLFWDPRYPMFRKKATHNLIRFRYDRFSKWGWVPSEHRTTLNKLSGFRSSARYLKGNLNINEKVAEELLLNVKKMIEDAEKRAT